MKPEQVMRRMHQFLNHQRENLDQFFGTQKATITDLYRIDQDMQRRKTSIERIEYLLNQKRMCPPHSPAYAKLRSELAVETGILQAIMQDTQKQMESVKKASKVQLKLSENLLSGKKEIAKLLKKLSSTGQI